MWSHDKCKCPNFDDFSDSHKKYRGHTVHFCEKMRQQNSIFLPFCCQFTSYDVNIGLSEQGIDFLKILLGQ